ncbi:MAG: hypothetical protein H0T46_29055 [Deltaproteobacteria bacterium]|nr:hypothetical protein [Deltaproteobacteria bacterium]
MSVLKLRVVLTALGLSLAAPGCGDPCKPQAKACPVLPNPPAKVPIDLAGMLAGFEGGGKGKGTFTVPVLGELGVTVDCSDLKIEKDTPEKGSTKVTGKCKFSKFGLGGTADLELVIDKDGKGHIAATGTSDFGDINVWVEIKSGVQAGQTITVSAEANGQCFTATLKRDGDKLIGEATDPKTKIEIGKK